MRLLCDTYGWYEGAADLRAARCDVVVWEPQTVQALWRDPRPDGWRAAVPPGWEPDVALFASPEYHGCWPFLRELPCPVALWIGDWYVGAQLALALGPQADLVLADAVGVAALRAAGLAHAEECCPWSYDPSLHRPDWDAPAEWDLGFVGNFNDAIHHRRNRWLARFARLPQPWRIRLANGLWGADFVRFVQRSRLSVNVSVTGDVNLRCFEAAACGSPVLLDRGAAEQAARWFVPGEEILLYDEDDVEDVVAEVLADEPRRRRIARAAHARVQEHGPAPRMGALLDRLERLARAGKRPGAPERTDLLAVASGILSWPPDHALAGLEQLLEAAPPGGVRAELARATLYARHAVVHPGQRGPAARWAAEHVARARGLAPDALVPRVAALQLAQSLGDAEAAAAVGAELLEGLDAGTLRPDRTHLLLHPTPSRPGYAWQRGVLADDPDDRHAGIARGLALEARAAVAPDLPARARLLAGAVEADPEEPAHRARLAATLLEAGDHRQALAVLDELLERRPLRADAWVMKGQALAALRDREGVEAWLDDLARLVDRIPDLAATRQAVVDAVDAVAALVAA